MNTIRGSLLALILTTSSAYGDRVERACIVELTKFWRQTQSLLDMGFEPEDMKKDLGSQGGGNPKVVKHQLAIIDALARSDEYRAYMSYRRAYDACVSATQDILLRNETFHQSLSMEEFDHSPT